MLSTAQIPICRRRDFIEGERGALGGAVLMGGGMGCRFVAKNNNNAADNGETHDNKEEVIVAEDVGLYLCAFGNHR